MSEPLSYEDLTEYMKRVGVIPRYTLHAHPSVIAALKAAIGPSGEYTALDDLQRLYPLTGIDVFPEEEWEGGRYELRKNGVTCMFGTISAEDGESTVGEERMRGGIEL